MKRKQLKTLAIAMVMTVAGCFSAFAASSRIGTLTVGFSEDKGEPGTVYEATPYCRTSGCEISDWSASADYADWKPGNKVTFDLTVETGDGYYFSSEKTKVNVSGNNAELISKRIKGKNVTMKVNYWPSITFDVPTNLTWNTDDEYVAEWDKVEYCKQYEVKIYIKDYDEEKTTTKTVTVDKPKVDLSSYATDGEITFQVRAVPKGDTQKKYCTASAWVDMNDPIEASSDNSVYGTFKENRSGEKTFSINDGGTASGWQYINNNWYYFNPANGNKAIVNDWGFINNNWFHFGTDGVMQSGWQKVNGYWYYLNNNLSSPDFGKMQTGWIASGPAGPWYYLNDGAASGAGWPYGACLTNTTTPDGYHVNGDGAWLN